MTDREVVSGDRIIALARRLDEGAEVELAVSDRDYSKPFQIAEVEVTDWGSYETARLRLNQGLTYFHADDHRIEATSGEPARWEQGDRSGRVHQFDPAALDDADLAALDLAERIEEATQVPDGGSLDCVVDRDESGEETAVAQRERSVDDLVDDEPASMLAGRVRCVGCGGSVTKNYARVFSPRENPSTVEACPDCEEMTRGRDGRARKNRNHVSARSD